MAQYMVDLPGNARLADCQALQREWLHPMPHVSTPLQRIVLANRYRAMIALHVTGTSSQLFLSLLKGDIRVEE